MRKLQLDSILLFALVIPFIMAVRIGPGDTPYWLFGIIFLLLCGHIVLDILSIKEKLRSLLKQIVLWITIVVVIGSAFSSAIIVRHQVAPVYMIHDIILQQESAIRFLLDGVNPYATTYFGTPLEQWNYSSTETNPALYHFVMQPLYVIFSLPFYFVSNHTIGYFDGRIPLLFLFLSTLLMGSLLIKEKLQKSLFLILMAFNPAMLSYTLEGRSDMFMFAFLFGGLALLYKHKFSLSAILMGLAFATKQSAWPILPFYIAYIFFSTKSIFKTLKHVGILGATFLCITLPFFMWDQKAFLDSTIFYLSGNTPHSYPISGYGFGKVLQSLGVIKDAAVYYPFHIWQLLIGIPIIFGFIRYIQRKTTVNRLLLAYGVFLFVFWYFSRYFNNSHLGYLSVVFITAYFWPSKENIKNN